MGGRVRGGRDNLRSRQTKSGVCVCTLSLSESACQTVEVTQSARLVCDLLSDDSSAFSWLFFFIFFK